LAFSIGGAIAWKFALINLMIISLNCISSTRLRYEKDKPQANTHLAFAKNDSNGPTNEWFESMNIDKNLIPNTTHEVYKEPAYISKLVKEIIPNIQ
jgi:hypothetical protein